MRQVFLNSLGCLVLHLRNGKSPLVLDWITIGAVVTCLGKTLGDVRFFKSLPKQCLVRLFSVCC